LYRLILHLVSKPKKQTNDFPLTFNLNDRKKLKTLFTIISAAIAAYHSKRTVQFYPIACTVTRRPRPTRFVRI
ncbi:MAG TPA: hypothetical protein VFG46_16645, partial [Chryseolinea sp.]|nr:hypothetical protein [Chryseolinea sp.]